MFYSIVVGHICTVLHNVGWAIGGWAIAQPLLGHHYIQIGGIGHHYIQHDYEGLLLFGRPRWSIGAFEGYRGRRGYVQQPLGWMCETAGPGAAYKCGRGPIQLHLEHHDQAVWPDPAPKLSPWFRNLLPSTISSRTCQSTRG